MLHNIGHSRVVSGTPTLSPMRDRPVLAWVGAPVLAARDFWHPCCSERWL
ncbi:MAG: hypothetical protein ACI9MR_003033 [Myxococcota bacterium]|jgi:hypothetical protein